MQYRFSLDAVSIHYRFGTHSVSIQDLFSRYRFSRYWPLIDSLSNGKNLLWILSIWWTMDELIIFNSIYRLFWFTTMPKITLPIYVIRLVSQAWPNGLIPDRFWSFAIHLLCLVWHSLEYKNEPLVLFEVDSLRKDKNAKLCEDMTFINVRIT